MLLTLNSISYRYPDAAAPILDGVSATFPCGWTAIIGDNGCGKTTLAKIAAGLLTPDTGSVTPTLLSAYCPQDSSCAPAALEDFALDWSTDAVVLRTLLSIDDGWLWDYGSLSGGQRKRIQIACALWSRPDVLIMDEPTNDLDAGTRALVGAALESYDGVGILISHDRTLLNALVRQCLMFEDGRTTMRPGSYSEAASQAAMERSTAAAEREAARRECNRLQHEAQRRRCEADRSKSRLNARSVGKKDNDKRERLGRARVSGKDGIASRSSATMGRRAAKARERLEAPYAPKRYDPAIEGVGEAARGRTVIHGPATTLQRGNFSLSVPELWVGPADRIAVTGPNGAGKSTLIAHGVAAATPGIRVAVIPQDVDERQRSEALAALHDADPAERGHLLSLVGRLNSAPERLLEGSDISPGELRKLMLAQQLAQKPHLLVLDEPTNHLDIGSIEALQEMLACFPGALLLATHDAELAAAVCNMRWTIGDGNVAVMPGGPVA